jgi:predicted amidophosphoribosyltransferase
VSDSWSCAAGAFLRALLDAVFPNLCPLCRGAAEDGFGCARHRLIFDAQKGPGGARCGRCSCTLPEPIPAGTLCASCRLHGSTPPIRALFDYHCDRASREWILAFKHRARPDLKEPLGEALARRFLALEEEPGRAVLLGLPAHPLRRFERGYDQARLLAESVGKSAGVRSVPALRRTRWTYPQGAPGSRSREANVRGAFRLVERYRSAVADARVWLIDDVVVSGASAQACREALRGVPLQSFTVLALARADRRRPGRLTGAGSGAEMNG